MGKKKLTKVALVGRPNVGKSALFNRICKKRIAIVDEMEGVTRDRLYAEADFFGSPFEVIDTGGIHQNSTQPFRDEVIRQAEIAIEEADSLIMVVDGQIGVTTLDEEVAHILVRKGKKVTLAVNKVDDALFEDRIYPFYQLGISDVIAVSASHGFQVAELLEIALQDVPIKAADEHADAIKVAIIGRPNVGKSTLVNHLLDEERCVVSPIAGTTRDHIDVSIEVEGQSYLLIDTAGIRRKKSEHEVVDKFAAIRTERAVDRSDVCVLMLDAVEGMTAQEKRIAKMIEAKGKGCLIIFNKWDLVKGYRMEHCLQRLHMDAPFLTFCPTLFSSAKSGKNTEPLFDRIKDIYIALGRRISTGQLNKFVEGAVQRYHPPMIKGKRLRIYYMAQVDIFPPKFVFFVNKIDLMTDTYKRYLLNQFRKEYGFMGAPLFLYVKGKKLSPQKELAK